MNTYRVLEDLSSIHNMDALACKDTHIIPIAKVNDEYV